MPTSAQQGNAASCFGSRKSIPLWYRRWQNVCNSDAAAELCADVHQQYVVSNTTEKKGSSIIVRNAVAFSDFTFQLQQSSLCKTPRPSDLCILMESLVCDDHVG